MPHVMFGARPRMLMSRRLVAQAGEYERAVRKYDKALRYIDQGGFLGEDKVQVPDAHHLPAVPLRAPTRSQARGYAPARAPPPLGLATSRLRAERVGGALAAGVRLVERNLAGALPL